MASDGRLHGLLLYSVVEPMVKRGQLDQPGLFDEAPTVALVVPPCATSSYEAGLVEQIARDHLALRDPHLDDSSFTRPFLEGRIQSYRAELARVKNDEPKPSTTG